MFKDSFATIGLILGYLEPCAGWSWRFQLSNGSFSFSASLYFNLKEIFSSILIQSYILVNIKQVSKEKKSKNWDLELLEGPEVRK